MINEHDMTRKMIDTMKDGRNLIREFINDDQNINGGEQNVTDNSNESSNDVIQLSAAERQPFEKQFKDIVERNTEFTVFNIYPKAQNVVFGGKIQGMGGIEFQLTLEDKNGIYITGNNIQITSEFVEQLHKMHGFYEQFRNDVLDMLDNDYKAK